VDLSQWVDSSGGVDQVIDKFKFTASGTVGTPSQSPAYVAGPDDAGQCLSVNAGKLYRNGAAVAQSSVTAVRGDSFKIELTASTPGATSGYIQRSAPTASGACPASPPTTGTVRLSKYTVSFLQVCPSNTASNCSAPIVFDKQHQYYGGNDTGLPIGNAARTVDLLIQTTATKYIVSDPYVGNGSIFSYGLCCEFNLLNPPLASATKLFDLQMTTSGQAFFTNEGTNIAAKKSLNDGAWHRITVTFDGAVVKLYYDGQLDATSDSSYSKTNTVGTTLRIGEDYRGLQWLGRFYRAAVWDRALTDSQVANIPYQVPLPTANLVSYYTVENPANPTLGLRNMVNNNITLIYATR